MVSLPPFSRRHLLAAPALFAGGWGCAEGPDPEPFESGPVWLSAQGRKDGQFGAGWVTPEGRDHAISTGFRGHDCVPHPARPNHALLVGRQPGREMCEIDLETGRVTRRVSCLPDYHLCGHACFSSDGRVVFSSESNFELGQGRIVVRDALDYRLLDDFPSHGIGPHELHFMPDERTLAVANGGLLTHPSSDREVLNLDTMRSTLSFVDSRNGELLGEVTVAEPKASIRHLDVAPDGTLSLALQMQRAASGHENPAPLAALYDEQRGLRLCSEPETLLVSCKDYMGSTRINHDARVAAFSSPRGDIALFFDIDRGEIVGYEQFFDVCGLAVTLDARHFVLSNSLGELRLVDASTLTEIPERRIDLPHMAWDNHLRATTLTTDLPRRSDGQRS